MASATGDVDIQPTNRRPVDLAFAMDCTGSMACYIMQAQQNIIKIAEDIVSKEQVDLRFALVEYRDHPPQESSFVTNVMDFTEQLREMKTRLDQCKADGGGDEPEAVADALHAVLKLSWRPDAVKICCTFAPPGGDEPEAVADALHAVLKLSWRPDAVKICVSGDEPEAVADALHAVLKLSWRPNAVKICVLIADAPPHGLVKSGDKFPKGCPLGFDPMVTARKLAEQEIAVYVVGCEPSITRYRDWFMAVSHITSGQYVPLLSAELLSQVIVGGTLEEISLASLMANVQAEIERHVAESGGHVNRGELEAQVFERLKGSRTKSVATDKGALLTASAEAEKLADLKSMAEVRKVFRPYDPNCASAATEAASPPPTKKVAFAKKVSVAKKALAPASSSASASSAPASASPATAASASSASSASASRYSTRYRLSATQPSSSATGTSAAVPAAASMTATEETKPSYYAAVEGEYSREQNSRLVSKCMASLKRKRK